VLAATGPELIFVPADPPRASHFATYPAEPGQADTRLDLVVPTASGVRRRAVPARTMGLADLLDHLARRPVEPAGTSTDAWTAATRLALELVARGRIQPGITESGVDTWRVGPLSPDDHRRIAALAAAFPPSAHAFAIDGSRPLRVRDGASLVIDFLDAVADIMVRTAAAGRVSGHPAYADREPCDVRGLERWLTEASAPVAATTARPGLRLELPEGADGGFVAVLQLTSAIDPSLVIAAADLWVAPALVASRFGDAAEADLLLALRRGARVWSPLQRLLDESKPSELALDDDEAVELLGGPGVALAGAGIDVLWPRELGVRAEVRASLGTSAPASVTEPALTMGALLEFRWEVAIGDEVLTADELAVLADAKRPLVRLRGRWVLADPELLARLSRQPRVRVADGLAASVTGQLTVDGEAVEVHLDGPVAALAERLRALDDTRELSEPVGLQATLRPYQRRGLAWLAEMSELGLGGCLADDMGLGKTVQIIALHLHEAEAQGRRGPMLVVCPTTLLGNWAREIERFAPGVVVRRYHGTGRRLDDLAPGEVVLTTYGTARRDAAALAEVQWVRVVSDEAQHVKNPLAGTARALRTIPAPSRIALTGTPVENRLSELWSILDWSVPGLLGSLETFRRQVALPIERDRNPDVTERFVRLVRPFLLRRRKSDPEIVPDLPPKTETDQVVPLTAEQATLYEAVVQDTMARIREAEGIQRQGLVFQLLTALKQVCDHPALYLRQRGPYAGRSGKLEALDELVDVITAEGDAVLVFSQYVEMCRILEAHLQARGVGSRFLHGGLTTKQRQEAVDAFQAGKAPVFLLSLKAGGTGLNLTQATHVIHYDRWWNPAVEDQASDRAWRIGQSRPVQVHRFLAEGTMEDRIAQVIASKRDLVERVVGQGEAWITQLSDDDLADLVRLGVG
jgi:hypothetical protein